MNDLLLVLVLLQAPQNVAKQDANVTNPPVAANAAEPGAVAGPVSATPSSTSAAAGDSKRTELNLLGKTNTESGEARRNENIQFNQIDNNAKKEISQRMGTTATLISEFRSERNYYGAEYGGNPVGAPHIEPLKSPAGAIHGSIFAVNGNSAWTARSFFQVGSVKPARDNQYGFNLGSALWKGSFLSLDASEQRISGFVNGNILVPLDSERMPRVTDPAAYALLQRFLNAYPSERPNRTDIDRRALNTNAPQSILTDTALIQLDQRLNSRDRLSAKYSFTSQDVDAFQLVAGQNPLTTTKAHSARLGWARTISPRTQVDTTLGLDRNRTLLVPEPNAVGPQVQIGTSYEKLGPQSNIPLDRIVNRFRYAAMLSSRQGNHSFSVGGEVIRAQFNTYEVSSNRGNYFFRSDFGRDAITNFLEGRPSRYSGSFGDPQRYHRGFEQQFYAGDVWRVASNLTLSYGIRYNPFTAPHEKTGLDRIDFSCDCNNIGPRFGFAYRLPGKAGVVRSAWGLHFGDIFPTTFQQTRWNQPNFQKFEVMAPDFLNPTQLVARGPEGRSIYSTYDSSLGTPYTNYYNFAWEGTLPGNWKIQTGYVGSRSRKLFMLWHLNRAAVVPGIAQTTLTVQDRRPNKQFFDMRYVKNAANAYFDAGRVTAIAPSWNGMTWDASYWFSKAIDTGASYLNTAAGDDARQGYSQTPDRVTEDLKGLSAFDQKHAVMVRMNYAMPKVSRLGMLESVFGKWNLNTVFLAKSGMPFTVISGSDGPGSGNVDGVNGDRPNILDPSILGMAVNRPEIRLERSAFGLIGPFEARGNIGSNTFRRGGIRNLNASLSRTWTIAGEKKLAFRAESINLFNTPQFAEPNPDLSSPAFGKITNTLNDGRTFRLQLRLSF
jgi:hypothetical protein